MGGYKTVGGGGMGSFTPVKWGGGKSLSHAEGGKHKKFWGIFYVVALSFSHIEMGVQKVSTWGWGTKSFTLS